MIWVYMALGMALVSIGLVVWFGRAVLQQHPIRVVALICVAALLVFLGYLAVWLTNTLSSPAWCGNALQAQRISSQNFGGLTACVSLLTIQLQALAENSKIVIGSFSFGLVVLIVIVLSGAKAGFQGPGGIGGQIMPGNDPASVAATHVANAADNAAAEVKANVSVTGPADAAPPPTPQYSGPAMPEPKGS